MVTNNPASLKNRAKLKNLSERLRNKLKDFAIINMQGQVLGYINDLFLSENRHLDLVIYKDKEKNPTNSPRYLLNSKYIEQVDSVNRSLFVNLTLPEVQQLPEYPINHHKNEMEGSENYPNSSAPQANIISSTSVEEIVENQPLENGNIVDSDDKSNVLEEEIVRLLEERLVVNRSKRKVGEVVVRKEIETRIVEVPIQYEKLIVEQVGSETKQLAEIDLGQGEVTGVEWVKDLGSNIPNQESGSTDKRYTVIGEFVSLKAASNLLDAIALKKNHGCGRVRVELAVEKPEDQATYQELFARCSIRSDIP